MRNLLALIEDILGLALRERVSVILNRGPFNMIHGVPYYCGDGIWSVGGSEFNVADVRQVTIGDGDGRWVVIVENKQ